MLTGGKRSLGCCSVRHELRAAARLCRPRAFSAPLRALSTAAGPEFALNVPHMGDSISEGTIVSWQKKAGDYVNVDDVVCVLETDKVGHWPVEGVD